MAFFWEKQDDEKDKVPSEYSRLEEQILKEAEGDIRAEKREAEERLKKESGAIYTTAAKSVQETAYKHMEDTEAEYNANSEEDERRRDY